MQISMASDPGVSMLQDLEIKATRGGLFSLIGPFNRPVTVEWDAVHCGNEGGPNSTAYARVYFSTPSTPHVASH